MTNEFVDPVGVIHDGRALITFQRTRDQIAKARQEIDAHTGVETIRVGTADSQKSNATAIDQRYQRGGTDFISVFMKQKRALCVSNLSAARGARQETS